MIYVNTCDVCVYDSVCFYFHCVADMQGSLCQSSCITFSSSDPKGHVRQCHHLASMSSSVNFYISIFFSETTDPIRIKHYRNVLRSLCFIWLLRSTQEKQETERFLNGFCLFLAHLARGNVSFCHHLASVVCRPSSVNFSHFNLLL